MNRFPRAGSLAAFAVVATLASAQALLPPTPQRPPNERRRWGERLIAAPPSPSAPANAYAGSVAFVAGLLSLAARSRRR